MLADRRISIEGYGSFNTEVVDGVVYYSPTMGYRFDENTGKYVFSADIPFPLHMVAISFLHPDQPDVVQSLTPEGTVLIFHRGEELTFVKNLLRSISQHIDKLPEDWDEFVEDAN